MFLILSIAFFIFGCGKVSEDIAMERTDEQEVLGGVERSLISFSSPSNSSKEREFKATINFSSENMIDYDGDFFSVKLLLKFANKTQENSYEDRILNEIKKLKNRYAVEKEIISLAFSGDDNVMTADVHYINSEHEKSKGFIEINPNDFAVFHEKFSQNREKSLYGIYQYKKVFREKYELIYQIKIYSFDAHSHLPFFYANRFFETQYES
jgi:hypothetical protein